MTPRPLFLADYWTLDLLMETDQPVAAVPQEARLLAKYKLPPQVEILDLSQALDGLRHGRFSRMVVSPRRGPFLDRQRPWLSRMWDMRRKIFKDNFRRQYQIPHVAIAQGVPISALNRVDEFHIPEWDQPILRAADVYWLRERPIQPYHALLNTSRRFRRLANLDIHPVFAHMKKVRSISLGVPDSRQALVPSSVTKRYDILFSATDTSPVREQVRQVLRRLQAGGEFRILLPETYLSREDYYRAAAESHLVISPSGLGWDCYRHYETALCGSVPVMNYPTIRRHQPFIEGEHGLYYDLEENGLERCLRQALANRERLVEMGRRARAHVLEHHLYSKLLHRILGPVPPED